MTILILGIKDRKLKRMAKCGKSKIDPHPCSNLHRLLAKTGKMLDVENSSIPLSILCVRCCRKRPQKAFDNYPVPWMWIPFSGMEGTFSWGGKPLDESQSFRQSCNTTQYLYSSIVLAFHAFTGSLKCPATDLFAFLHQHVFSYHDTNSI